MANLLLCRLRASRTAQRAPFGGIQMRSLLAVAAATCSIGCASIVEYADATWVNATANLAGMPSECGNLSFLSSRSDRDVLIAGVALQGLWGSSKATGDWSAMGRSAGSATIVNRASSIVYDPDHAETFWESGLYNGGGVYRTDDDGATFHQLGTDSHFEMVSVDLSDPARRTLLAGGHEAGRRLLLSVDAGSSWNDIGLRFPESAGDTSFPLVLDSSTYLVGTARGTASGIFRSEDGGNTWTRVFDAPVRARPLLASDGAIYWTLDNYQGLARSTDHGRQWALSTGHGVLSTTASGSLLELPDGRFAALGGGYVVISGDHASSWKRFGSPLPYSPSGLVYSTFRKAFYVWHFGCGAPPDPVPSDAILALAFDWVTQ